MNVSRMYPKLLKPLNPKKLGYILKDGSVQFGDQQTAIEYAKGQIVEALNMSKPFERAAVIRGGRVAVVDGEAHRVDLKKLPPFKEVDITLHGHPTHKAGITMPFSAGDIKTFLHMKFVNNLKKSIVYNPQGEACVMTANSNTYSLFDKLPEFVKDIFYVCNPKIDKKLKLVDKHCIPYSQVKNKTFYDVYARSSKDEVEKINELMAKTNKTPEEEEFLKEFVTRKSKALTMHDSIKELAGKLGFGYKTNFSTLVG